MIWLSRDRNQQCSKHFYNLRDNLTAAEPAFLVKAVHVIPPISL